MNKGTTTPKHKKGNSTYKHKHTQLNKSKNTTHGATHTNKQTTTWTNGQPKQHIKRGIAYKTNISKLTHETKHNRWNGKHKQAKTNT